MEFPSVKFVEVPLTKENAYLHDGLGVPSLPFAQLNHTCNKGSFIQTDSLSYLMRKYIKLCRGTTVYYTPKEDDDSFSILNC